MAASRTAGAPNFMGLVIEESKLNTIIQVLFGLDVGDKCLSLLLEIWMVQTKPDVLVLLCRGRCSRM